MTEVRTKVKEIESRETSMGKEYWRVTDEEGNTFFLWDRRLLQLLAKDEEVILQVQGLESRRKIVGVKSVEQEPASKEEKRSQAGSSFLILSTALELALKLAEAKLMAGKEVKESEVVEQARAFESYLKGR